MHVLLITAWLVIIRIALLTYSYVYIAICLFQVFNLDKSTHKLCHLQTEETYAK